MPGLQGKEFFPGGLRPEDLFPEGVKRRQPGGHLPGRERLDAAGGPEGVPVVVPFFLLRYKFRRFPFQLPPPLRQGIVRRPEIRQDMDALRLPA
ncbi:MAG: hypothetical protein BWX69_03205 [Planctomycetes bacterium ADurb.Bin069]|nr:MAG: hypothetical protein BWX69_03205 [Planctomycetes bacterium ADurb.Bin069]